MSSGADSTKSPKRKIEISKDDFKTKAGKILATNLSDLYEFTISIFTVTALFGNYKSFTNAIFGSNLGSFLPEFADLSNLRKSDLLKFKEDILTGKGLEMTDENLTTITDDDIKQTLKAGLDSVQKGQDDLDNILSNFDVNPRLNAYFFLALEGYLQVYSKSLYGFIIENAPKKQRVELASSYSDTINAEPLIANLMNANKKFIKKLIKEKGTTTSTENFLPTLAKINAMRKILAHGQPK
ncbi:MAG: hypothetical protein IH840_15955, partial [Candidatus Heimdallarchaeota archaeon]|nr:hypothetical protein [Candidatus Heimdallarchaeota archaeon]